MGKARISELNFVRGHETDTRKQILADTATVDMRSRALPSLAEPERKTEVKLNYSETQVLEDTISCKEGGCRWRGWSGEVARIHGCKCR